jgi:hypothetical protein
MDIDLNGQGSVADTCNITYMKDPLIIETIGLETLGVIGFKNKDKALLQRCVGKSVSQAV